MTWTAGYEVLQQPGIYPESTVKVEVYETHISWVYLTDRYVYKIKKPVDLGFLNFSTLEQRRYFCEQELALNRRLSTDVYLDVTPLYQSDHHVNFDGDGAVVDYAVKMRRLPEEHALHTMLRRGPLSNSEARQDMLSDFQRAYEPVCKDDRTCHIRLDTTQEVGSRVQQALAAIYGS